VGALRRFLDGAPARGIPVVWTVHNLTAHEPVPIIDRAGFQALHRRAALRVFHSRWARDAAVARFAGGATLVAPHPNYDGVFPPARPRERTEAELGLPPGRTLLLCFGGIRHYKGFDVAIEAMRHLRGGRFHLLIIGRGPSRVSGRLRALAGARTDITLLLDGPASDQLVADAIAASDVVLLPYREVTTSGALLAALTLSRGVIASDLPYFREVLSPHGQAGEFAAPGDAAALAAAIEAYGAVDIATRGRAARAIADRCPISAAVQPLADWLRSTVVPQGASAVPT
jgi:glycosyltransferase involved in cell wall biosynthesis